MPATKLKRGAKSAFIRKHPGKSASEVVELAAREGIKLNQQAVYNARAAGKSERKKSKKTMGHDVGHGEHLQIAVEFCRINGGIAEARKMLSLLESLQLG